MGVVSAFFPFQERPLEVWLWNFFKRVYSPTVFLWQREEKKVVYSPLASPSLPSQPGAQKVKIEDKRPRMKEFLHTLPSSEEKEPVVSSAPPQKKKTKKKPSPSLVPEREDLSPEVLAQIEKVFQKKISGEFRSPQFEEAPLPATPTIPNIVNGVVVDEEGRVIEGAIVEIQDIEGNPIRAMRTNRLGQFQTATPLPQGSYLVIVEKEPYQFDIIKIEVKGEVIAPLRIQAKKGVAA